MNSLQSQSLKIRKNSRKNDEGSRGFTCGGCSKSYKSYPALYLHIKRKHDGIKPPNTKTLRSKGSPFDATTPTGRPHKPARDIDDVSDSELNLESVHNVFFHLLGDKIMAINNYEPKLKVQDVVLKIQANLKETPDSWLKDIREKAQEYWNYYSAKYKSTLETELDDEPLHLDPNDSLRALVWFILWLGKYYVKTDFLPDLCTIISRVWRVLDEVKLSVKDLDNKLVWKKVAKETLDVSSSLKYFKNSQDLLLEFIEKTCQMIDRLFQTKD